MGGCVFVSWCWGLISGGLNSMGWAQLIVVISVSGISIGCVACRYARMESLGWACSRFKVPRYI